jgi:ABC-type antimicrobial peptide transport system permease subunit
MRFFIRILVLAVNALRRNKMRSGLTALGIIFGVAAVIAMVEVGQGASTAMQKTIQNMGADNLLVQPGAAASGGASFGSGSVTTLSPQDAEAILRDCPAVRETAPVVRARTQVVYGNRNWVPTYIYGTTPAFLSIRDWNELDDGDVFTTRDVRNGSKVCLIGQTLVKELFQGESPIGKEIRVQSVSFRVVGVLSRKGSNMMGIDQDDIVLAPWTTIKYRVSGNNLSSVNQSAVTKTDTSQQVNSLTQLYPNLDQSALYPIPSPTQAADTPQPVRFTNVDQVLVRAASTEQIPQAIRQITTLLHERHRIKPGQSDDFNIRDMTEINMAFTKNTDFMRNMLLCVACISLVVGGVGIMNIMLVSVTERTREIGLRMAVGARARDILRQFLVEAILLCLLGGAIGILLGRLCSLFLEGGEINFLGRRIQWGLHLPVEASWPALVAAFAVSATVGVIFGYYPAWKASRLDPIEALRYE